MRYTKNKKIPGSLPGPGKLFSFFLNRHLRVVFLQVELQVGGRLRGLDGLPLVHLHGLLPHGQLLVQRRKVVLEEALLLLQFSDDLGQML
jgi:hypothetical protein